ncbi:MAG: phosphate ABC transporter substrate-binding protein, partial [Halobacteria archaeon]|nr:phosphate ABC transporter substrate-binding protein [Halobacteria archaeon]
MMSDKRVSRRKILYMTGGAVGSMGIAGCMGGNSDGGNGNGGGGNNTNSGQMGGTGGQDTSTLTAEGSSTVYPIANSGARLWNGNPPASDKEYWGPSDYGIDTDMNLADYFASKY